MADGGIATDSSGGRLQQRILQVAGRRYSLRLETRYWQSLTALAADASGRIIAVNAPLSAWLGTPAGPLTGTPLLRHFRFHCRAGCAVEALWKELGGSWATAESTRMIHIAPGRVLAANARLVPVIVTRGRPLCVVWVTK